MFRYTIVILFCMTTITIFIQAQTASIPIDALITITGDAEIVFDWTTDRCDDEDIPDLPARAFRDSDEQVQLISTHFIGRRMLGESLDNLERDCDVIAQSVYDADPSQYSDKEWLASLYTEDGDTIYVLQHNEYQGHTHAGQCPSGEYFNCWYNSLTLAMSTDGGASYRNADSPPNHVVATLPYAYEAEAGLYGIFEPSNMIDGGDGYIYAFIRVDDYQSPEQWTCLMRTDNITEASSWRAWGGTDFSIEFLNPYIDEIPSPEANLCAPIAQDDIGTMNSSITYNTYLEQYVLVGISADQIDGREVWGIYYAFSKDLLHWSRRQLLREVELPWTYTLGDNDPILYPSLINPNSDSRNFSTSGQTAYLYFTQFNYANGQMTLDRDLMRVPLEFSALTVDAPQYDLTHTGTVPENATDALLGYRINTECDCNGTADFILHAMHYSEDGSSDNLVPNSVFAGGLSAWFFGGDGDYELLDSDLSAGQMLQVNVSSSQMASMNGEVFPVTANATYTLTFTAEIMPTTTDTGYFTIIFLDGQSETSRELIPLVPNSDG